MNHNTRQNMQKLKSQYLQSQPIRTWTTDQATTSNFFHFFFLLPIRILSESKTSMIVGSTVAEQLLTVIRIWKTQYNYSDREARKSFYKVLKRRNQVSK